MEQITARDVVRQQVNDLLNRLEGENDECVVISLAAEKTGDNWNLRHGSAVIGPALMASMSWLQWSDEEMGEISALTRLLAVWGFSPVPWRKFDREVGEWRLLRFTLAAFELCDWLTDLLVEGTVNLPEFWPTMSARAAAADALVRLFAQEDTPGARLAKSVGRPLVGWLHPIEPSAMDAANALPPEEWPIVPGRTLPGTTLALLGIATGGTSGTLPATGLLVARAERLAWITKIQGASDLATFNVRIRLDPTRVALWELVIDLEENDGAGQLLTARRLNLGDVSLPVHGQSEVTVELPTLGIGVRRQVRLFHQDGRLLDRANNVRLVAGIELTVETGGLPPISSTVGETLEGVTLVQRLAALDRTEQEYEDMLAGGVRDRVIGAGDAGVDLLRDLLRAARGDLSVIDPFFFNGRNANAASVLDEVSVPVRILTGDGGQIPAQTAPKAPAFEVRRLMRGRTPPFHDRFYLWDGGGLFVGTSPNGLGNRLSLIDRLSPAIVRNLREHFELWWQDPAARSSVRRNQVP